MITLTVNRSVLLLILLFIATPVSTAVRMSNCDYETVDWNGIVRVRAEYCMVNTDGAITEITVGQRPDRWVINGANAQLLTTAMSWDRTAQRWYHDGAQDRLLWTGSVKPDQTACRFGGKASIRYVFSDGTAICLQ